MQSNRTRSIVLAGLFAALGLIIPYATSHALGLPGTLLLPMHLPVLLCGLLCGPQLGAVCGLLVPVLSSLLTGMPPAYPMLPIMLFQLTVMGAVGGYFYQTRKAPLLLAVVLSMAAGWATYGLVYAALFFAGNGQLRALSVGAALAQGVPGLLLQLVVAPGVVALVSQALRGPVRGGPDYSRAPEADPLFDQAIRLISGGTASCVVIQNGAIVHAADGRGVAPLMALHDNSPEVFQNAFVVDKIIGKAAAMILVAGGARKVYGLTMSAAGREYLQKRGVEVYFGRCVDVISNRDQTGICPIERSVLGHDDPAAGIETIRATVQALRNAVG